MIVILHIAVALASIVTVSYAYVRPSVAVLRSSYALVGLTFASGFYMVLSSPAYMIQACLSGIAYLAVVSLAIVAVRHKLIIATKNNSVE